MTDWLAAQSAINPSKPFLLFEGQTHSFSAVNKQAGLWAAKLKELKVKQDDVVAVLLNNQAECVYLCFALMRLGAILLPLNTRFTENELEYQLKKTKAKLLLSQSDVFKGVAGLKRVLPCHLLDDELMHDVLEPILSATVNLEATFCIMFTSGTTGKPKGVCLSLKNFFYSANASAYRLGLDVNDVWLCAMPLYHVGGLSIVLRSCLYGTAVLLHARFELEAVTKALADEQQAVSLVSLVPTMLYRLLQDADFRASPSLRLILLGGAAAPTKLLQDAKARNLKVLTTYGLSEACSQVATLSPDALLQTEGQSSVGNALMFTEIKIVNDTGEELAVNQVGDIMVCGPTVMKAYFEDDMATQKALQDGWLVTGDIGYKDETGMLFVETRRADLIVSGGENIYPKEIEDVLEAHSRVQQACVLGLPHEEWGQQVIAVVVLMEGGEASEKGLQLLVATRVRKDLNELCKKHLASYKKPRDYFVTSVLPLTASGKVKRHELRAMLENQDKI